MNSGTRETLHIVAVIALVIATATCARTLETPKNQRADPCSSVPTEALAGEARESSFCCATFERRECGKVSVASGEGCRETEWSPTAKNSCIDGNTLKDGIKGNAFDCRGEAFDSATGALRWCVLR